MLLIAPQLVDMSASEPITNLPTFPWAEGDLLRSPQAGLFRTMREMTPHGAYGDPSFASAEKGRRIVDLVCDALTVILKDMARPKK